MQGQHTQPGVPPVLGFRFNICSDPLAHQYHFSSKIPLCPQIIKYKICPHRERYKFMPNSSLKNYLEDHCHGFVKDPEEQYTINYIIYILLVNWGLRGLVVPCQNSVRATSYIKKAFKTTSPVIGLRGLRRRVVDQLDAAIEDFYLRMDTQSYNIPLWCVEEKELDSLCPLIRSPFCSTECTQHLNRYICTDP